MRFWYKLRRWCWDISSDLGETVAVLIGFVLAVAVICLFWLAFVEVERWLR